jgi:hypothetical protein
MKLQHRPSVVKIVLEENTANHQALEGKTRVLKEINVLDDEETQLNKNDSRIKRQNHKGL